MSLPVRAYSYVRMSTDMQLHGDSLRRQNELSQRYADTHGLQLDDSLNLRDIGVSAFKGANADQGNLGKFLRAVREGFVPAGSFLLVESLDRLTRQKFREAVRLFFELTDAGINVVTLADEHVYQAGQTRLEDLLLPFLIMSRANEESEIKSFRLAKAWEEKRRRSSTEKLTSICPHWLTLDNSRKSFLVNEERVTVVRQIFDWAAGGAGTHVIVRRLNDLRIPAFRSGLRWGASSVTKLLNNRAVLGEYQPHKKVGGKRQPIGEPLRNYFPPIIDEDLFLRVQLERRSRGKMGGGRIGKHKRNLFTHLAICTFCGSPMYLVNKGPGPKGGTYLRCRQAAAGGPCDAAGWPYADFEKSFFFFVREADLASIMSDSSSSKLSAIQDDIRLHEARMSALLEKRERVFALLHEADFDASFVRDKLSGIEADIALQRAAHEGLLAKRTETFSATDAPGRVLKLIAELQSNTEAALDKRIRLASQLRQIIRSINVFCRRRATQGSFDRGCVVVLSDGRARIVTVSGDPLEAESHFLMDGRPLPDFKNLEEAVAKGLRS